MKKERYYVYCKNVLGIKTNVSNFRWVYGSVAPLASECEYSNCDVKIELNIIPESKLPIISDYDKKFQSYLWSDITETLSCRRKIFGKINIGYDIVVKDNFITVNMGSNYYKLVKKRVMNLHDCYYLLSDVANIVLSSYGYLTLYASAVYLPKQRRGIVCFAPPNTGKTLTATQLCDKHGYELIGEDVVLIRDGEILSCPYTSSYRNKNAFLDSSGAFSRVLKKDGIDNVRHRAKITDIALLVNGNDSQTSNEEIYRSISILNGYLFNYNSSPIVKIMGYFNSVYDVSWDERAKALLKQLVESNKCHVVYSKRPMEFAEKIHAIVEEVSH